MCSETPETAARDGLFSIGVSEEYASELFSKYDEDDSGSIDRSEFRAIAREMQDGVNRRILIGALASGLGAYAVAVKSEEYQFAQKISRALVQPEPAAEATMRAFFPKALLSYDAAEAIQSTLYRRGFSPRNTLFAHSVCPDEVNAKSEELEALLSKRWGEAFTLGGLAGIPFAGRSGFRAYLHHCPDDGKLLILLAPHVGIAQLDAEGTGTSTATGRVGALKREGQSKLATACGAAVGAYKANVAKRKEEPPQNAAASTSPPVAGSPASNGVRDSAQGVYEFDPQIEFIKEQLLPRLDGIENAKDEITYVTYQLYTIARELLYAEIAAATDLFEWCNEVAVVGGVLINRAEGGDFFMPLGLQTRTKGSDAVQDLYEEAFGPRPQAELAGVLGSEELANRVLFPSVVSLGGGEPAFSSSAARQLYKPATFGSWRLRERGFTQLF